MFLLLRSIIYIILLFAIKHDTAFVYCKGIFTFVDFVFMIPLAVTSWMIIFSPESSAVMGVFTLVSPTNTTNLYYSLLASTGYLSLISLWVFGMTFYLIMLSCKACNNSLPWESLDKYYNPANIFYDSKIAIYLRGKRALGNMNNVTV